MHWLLVITGTLLIVVARLYHLLHSPQWTEMQSAMYLSPCWIGGVLLIGAGFELWLKRKDRR